MVIGNNLFGTAIPPSNYDPRQTASPMSNQTSTPTWGDIISAIDNLSSNQDAINKRMDELIDRIEQMGPYEISSSEDVKETTNWQDKEEDRREKSLRLYADLLTIIVAKASNIDFLGVEPIIEAADQFDHYVRSGMTPKQEQKARNELNKPSGVMLTHCLNMARERLAELEALKAAENTELWEDDQGALGDDDRPHAGTEAHIPLADRIAMLDEHLNALKAIKAKQDADLADIKAVQVDETSPQDRYAKGYDEQDDITFADYIKATTETE